MKKLLFLFTTLLLPELIYAQQGSVNATAIHSQVVDSATVTKPLHYGTQWYSKQAEKWRIRENGVDYDLIPKFVKSPSVGYLNWDGTRFRFSAVTSGITNSASNTELMMSDGTNAIHSALFADATGNLTMGTGKAGPTRFIGADGTASDVGLFLFTKGNAPISLDAMAITIGAATGATPGDYLIQGAASNVSGVKGSDIKILSGGGGAGNANSGNIYIDNGGKHGSGVIGNLGIFSLSATFGSGQKVAFIGDAIANPSSNPTAGFILYSDASNSSHPTVRLPSGTTYDLISPITGVISPTHIQSTQLSLPTVVLGTGGGTGASYSISGGTDLEGLFTLDTGTSPATSAIIATITFASAYATAPGVVLYPHNAAAATISTTAPIYTTSTTGTFVINSTTTGLTGSIHYEWVYHVLR